MPRQLFVCAVVLLIPTPLVAEEVIKPAEYLASLQAPVFAEGHTLPPLTRYGWTLSYDARVELARRWGYALELGGYVTEKTVEKLEDPESVESRLVKLAHDSPEVFKLSVICSRRLPFEEAPVEAWTRDASGRLLDANARSLDGTQWQRGMRLVWSPEAPESVWKMAGKFRADPIREVGQRCPIAIVLNGGEYGLGVLGFAQKAWAQDPRIVKAKGDTPWYDYIRSGDLLPGPARHVWSKQQPAYGFPTGDEDVRVLVRRRKGQAAWLVIAWAAGGEARDVKVTIPELGERAFHARPDGNVYLVQSAGGTTTSQLMEQKN